MTHRFALVDGSTVIITQANGSLVTSFAINPDARWEHELNRNGWRMVSLDWGLRERDGRRLPSCAVMPNT